MLLVVRWYPYAPGRPELTVNHGVLPCHELGCSDSSVLCSMPSTRCSRIRSRSASGVLSMALGPFHFDAWDRDCGRCVPGGRRIPTPSFPPLAAQPNDSRDARTPGRDELFSRRCRRGCRPRGKRRGL